MEFLESIGQNIISIASVFGAFMVLAKFEFKYNPLRWLVNKFTDITNSFIEIKEQMQTNETKQDERFENQDKRFDKIDERLENHDIAILRLTICNKDIPITERIKAGDSYLKKGGNGEVSVIYNKLLKTYGEKIG